MTRLSAAGLLAVWEAALGRAPGERAVAVLAGCGEPDPGALPAGERDRRLAAVYAGLFGRRPAARADCPGCGADLEVELDLDAFAAPAAPPAAGELDVAGCAVRWRPPTADDLAAVARLADPAAGYRELLGRVVTEVRRGDEVLTPAGWPAGLGEAVGAAVATADPLAAAEVGGDCPACGVGWTLGFDPGSFLWAELEFAAHRLLADVHRLAAAYGWAEADILNLSAARRAAYLKMCGA